MLELLLSPRMAERKPWTMFFVGLVYAALSVALVNWVFGQDQVLSKYSGILVVTFTVMFSLPFMYYLIKNEEERDEKNSGAFRILRDHSKSLTALLFLFLGFVVAFSLCYMMFESNQSFKAQIETYCAINKPSNFDSCVSQYQAMKSTVKATASSISTDRIFAIFANNIYVLIFTIVFSLIFGAGAIFILAWNASVIAAAIGIFTRSDISQLPLGLARYMIHGLPEIAAYFIGAIAGGIISMGIIKHELKNNNFWNITQDSLNLLIVAIVILFLAALIEVFITPALF